MDTSHHFPQGELATITLGKDGARVGLRQDLPSSQWLSPPCQRQGLVPSCQSRSSELALFPLSVCFLLSQDQDPCLRVGSKEARGRRLYRCSQLVLASDRSELSPVCCLCRCQQSLPSFHSDAALGPSLCSSVDHCLQPPLPLPCCGVTLRVRGVGCVDSQYVPCVSYWEQLLSEIQAASSVLLEYVPTKAATTSPRLHLRTG